MPFCDAPFWDSVAHPPNCWVRHRILATKIISVAHPARCATEIARQHPYTEAFCGALFLGAPQKVVRHKNKKRAPQKYETEIPVFFRFAVQIQVYTGFIQVYTEIQVYLTGI